MLTPKREKFVRNLISGMSQREAYRNAYDTERMKQSTVDKKASEIVKLPEVAQRIAELKEKFTERALYTREQAVKDLLWMQDNARDDIETNGINKANAPAFLNATKQLTDLCGLNVQKLEISGVDKEISKLDALISQITDGDDTG